MLSELLSFWLKLTPGVGDPLSSRFVHSQVHAGSIKVVSCCGFGVDDPLLSRFVGSQTHAGSLRVLLESKLEVEDAFDADAAPIGVKVGVGDRGEPGPGLGVGLEIEESPTLRVGEVVWFDLAGGEVVATSETPLTRWEIFFRVEWCWSRVDPTARSASAAFLSEDVQTGDVAFASLPVDGF